MTDLALFHMSSSPLRRCPMSAAPQQSPPLCAGRQSKPWAPLAVCRTARVLGGNTFISNPSWPTSWWTWPPPRRITRSLHLLKTKATLQTCRLNSRLRVGKSLPGLRGAAGQPLLNMWKGKSEAEMLAAVICIERNRAGVITHRVMQEWFGGNLCLVQMLGLSLLLHGRNTHSTCTHTHTHWGTDQADPALRIF